MDMEKLIRVVQLQKPIWDQTSSNHHNRFALELCWKEVGKEFPGIDVKRLRKKWKNLRDAFRKKLLESFQGKQSGDPATEILKEQSWQYFAPLSFLKEQFTPCDFENENVTPKIDEVEPNDEEYPESPATSTSFVSVERSGKRGVSLPRVGEQLLASENKRVKLEKRKEKCEDMLFFESLLSHVKNIPDCTKLLFRTEVQNLVQKYAYPKRDQVRLKVEEVFIDETEAL